MAESLADQVVRKIHQTDGLFYRLILVVAAVGKGKTTALLDVQNRIDAPLFNVNLKLSRLMLGLTERQRKVRLQQLLQEVVSNTPGSIILFDNIEMLFNVALEQNPLPLLQGLARNKTIVTTWSGSIKDQRIIYAEPGHPEYRSYTIGDFLVASPDLHGGRQG